MTLHTYLRNLMKSLASFRNKSFKVPYKEFDTPDEPKKVRNRPI